MSLTVRDAIAKLREVAEDLDEDAPLEVLTSMLNTIPVLDIEVIDDHVIVHFEGSPRPEVARVLLDPDDIEAAKRRLRGES